jgi:hypothetical protein
MIKQSYEITTLINWGMSSYFWDLLHKVWATEPRRNKSATLNTGKTAEAASGRSRI